MTCKTKVIIAATLIYITGIITGICIGTFSAHKNISMIKRAKGGRRHGFMMKNVFDKLSLTDEQKAIIEEQLSSLKDIPHKNFEHFKTQREAQKALIDAEEFDETAFRENCRKSAKMKEDLSVKHALAKRKIRLCLTDEQKAEMDRMISNMKECYKKKGK